MSIKTKSENQMNQQFHQNSINHLANAEIELAILFSSIPLFKAKVLDFINNFRTVAETENNEDLLPINYFFFIIIATESNLVCKNI